MQYFQKSQSWSISVEEMGMVLVGGWEEAWTQEYAGACGAAVNPHQLIVYEDKAKIAMDNHAAKLKLRKGKKKKRRPLKDFNAYLEGERDAGKVSLGSKRIEPSSA
jgi:hypothetical protein